MYDKDIELLERLLGSAKCGPWAVRILCELEYLKNLHLQRGKELPEDIRIAIRKLDALWMENGAITKADALAVEEELSAYGAEAKSIGLWCAGHAHIDMNWMWGMPETVGITIDTFQTVLNLMKEYPQFIFSQSQASTYEIIEKYCPSMLPEIRERIHEGRWEITASQWVEGDKNMAGTEALCRHLLYTKEYLSKLFDIDPNSLELDFEPDTFGHNENMPEILSQGGVKYFYHSRGYDGYNVYRWRAPSGAEVLAFRALEWYQGEIEWNFAKDTAFWAEKAGTNQLLWLYGVGDHGGGPTRRDIERLTLMQEWPLYPTIRFSTLRDYFKEIEKVRERFPVVQQELNFVFTGCYTTQTRIKQANRMGEERLGNSEALCVMADTAGVGVKEKASFADAWKKVLFNHFHDILPGSGIPETCQYSLGSFQEALSAATANANRAMRAIAENTDTTLWGDVFDPESQAEGGGVGAGVMQNPSMDLTMVAKYDFGTTGRAGGGVRPYTLLNPTQYDRDETTEISVWDWPLDPGHTEVTDSNGKVVPFTVMSTDPGKWAYMGHKLMRIAFRAKVPAYGFANYYVRRARDAFSMSFDENPRTHTMQDGLRVLENEKLKACFDSRTLRLVSLTDKKTGKEMLSSDQPSGTFRLVEERTNYGYSAWVVGDYGRVEDILENNLIRILEEKLDGKKQWITYEVKFRASSIRVTVSLGSGDDMLRFSVRADWHEIGNEERDVQLQFYAPLGYAPVCYRYDEAAGVIDRAALGHDVPALTYAAAVPEEGRGVMVTSDCKYGFRGNENALTINLIRASHSPDPYPDHGHQQIELGIGVTDMDAYALDAKSVKFSQPIFVQSTPVHPGVLGQEGSLLNVSGCKVYGMKEAEDGNGYVMRLGNLKGADASAVVSLDGSVSFADVCENACEAVSSGVKHTLNVPAKALRTVKIH